MIGKEEVNYAVRNLMNRKTRTSLTLLSIFVGITTIFIFISFGLGLYLYVEEFATEAGVDKLIVQAEGIGAPGTDDTFALTDGELDVFRKTNGVAEAGAVSFGSAEIEKDNKLRFQYLVGFPTNDKDELALVIEWWTIEIIEGRNLEKGDDDKAVLGYNYQIPDRIFEKPIKVGDSVEVNGEKLRVVGFFEELGNPSDDANIYVTEDAYLRLQNETTENYGFLVGRVSNVDEIELIVERATKDIRKFRGQEEGEEDFFIQTNQELIASFQTSLNIIIAFVILIAFISVIVSAINTSNTMFTSILERTREIGVLKAIGAQNGEILFIFLMESSIIGFLAGVVGVALGWIISAAGGSLLDALGWGFLQPRFNIALFVGCILFSTIVGLISGIIPAYNASRKNPVDSLRYE